MRRMGSAFRSVGLVGKYGSPDVADPLLRLAEFLERRGVEVLLDEGSSRQAGPSRGRVLPLDELARRAELVVAIGGDGTMLNVARALAPHDIALVGVNQGRLGFLTDISVETMFETLGAILEGRFVAEDRMLLAGEVWRDGGKTFEALALNDVVVSKGARGSLMEFEARVDGEFLYSQRADGLIVATPTGSTAYALSAGGPIVHPSLAVIALVPVSPHTLSNRPIVVSSECTVEIVVHSDSDPRVHFDSHSHCELVEADRVRVRRYPRPLRLLHPPGHSYYNMLREKLNWNRE
jgi:NAD+ kinase